MLLLLWTLALSGLLALAVPSDIILMNGDNFDNLIGKGQAALVQFYTPDCKWCKKIAYDYEEVAHSYSHLKKKLIIGRVDASEDGKLLAERFGVKEYPTVKWFDAEGNESKYDAELELDSFINFITRKTGFKSRLPPPPATDIVRLDKRNFEDIVMDNKNDVVVLYTTPWCGHCLIIQPEYEKLATTFLPESDCVVATILGDRDKHGDILDQQNVHSFPTVKFYAKGNKNGEVYIGGAKESELVAWLNKKCKTKRVAGGGLNSQAGLVPELDVLAHKFFIAAAEERDTLFKEATKIGENFGEGAKAYIHVMEKITNGSTEYVKKEAKRLEGILKKKNLSPAKLDEIKVKANVLKSFTKERKPKKSKTTKPKKERSDSEL